jgi:hypothetical protein
MVPYSTTRRLRINEIENIYLFFTNDTCTFDSIVDKYGCIEYLGKYSTPMYFYVLELYVTTQRYINRLRLTIPAFLFSAT